MAVQVCSGQYNVTISAFEQATICFNTAAQFPASIANNLQLANGTAGALNVDTIHAKQYTLASTTTTINLFDGSLLSPSGAACVFARVRLFAVSVVDTTASHRINVQSGASSGVLWLPPAANTLWATPGGGNLILFDPNGITTAGYLVVTGNKNITFDSLSVTVIFNVLILGNSSAS